MTKTVRVANGYVPHANQTRFHASKAKFRGIITGIGFGKSAAGSNEILRMALEHPRAMGIIMAPTSKVLRNATLPQFFKFVPREFIERHIESKNLIILANGARIVYLSADNQRHIDRLSGMEIGYFWADEARLFSYGLWEMLIGRLRDANGPLRGVVTTSPKGRGHWLYKLFVKKTDPRTNQPLKNASDYEFFGGTTLENPHTPEEYKRTLLATYHGNFLRQEVYGEFTTFEGMVYGNFSENRHIVKVTAIRLGAAGHELDITFPNGTKKTVLVKEWIDGIDHGFTNPRVALLLAVDGDNRCYAIKEHYRSQTHAADLARWLNAQAAAIGIKDWRHYADPSEPGDIAVLKQAGLNVRVADNDVAPGLTDVYNQLSVRDDGTCGLYLSEECVHTIDEIGQYRYADAKEEKEVKEVPLKVNDHAMDALRYAIRSHIGRPRGRIAVLSDPEGILGLGG